MTQSWLGRPRVYKREMPAISRKERVHKVAKNSLSHFLEQEKDVRLE